jgi:hypothetical protein
VICSTYRNADRYLLEEKAAEIEAPIRTLASKPGTVERTAGIEQSN